MAEDRAVARRLWVIAAVAILCIGAWGLFGTGVPNVLACRIGGGRPTTVPTMLTLSDDPGVRPVPIVMSACAK